MEPVVQETGRPIPVQISRRLLEHHTPQLRAQETPRVLLPINVTRSSKRNTDGHFTFLTTNTNGICTNTKLAELDIVLRNHHIDVAVIAESHLTTEVPDTRVSLPEYDVIRCDRNLHAVNKCKGGGVLIYLESCINYLKPDVKVPEELEVAWCILSPSQRDSVIVAGVYLPPDAPAARRKLLMDHLLQTVDQIRSTRPKAYTVLLGDFNSSFDAKQLSNHLNLRQIVTLPTRGAAVLDHIFTDFPTPSTPAVLSGVGTADHCGLVRRQ